MRKSILNISTHFTLTRDQLSMLAVHECLTHDDVLESFEPEAASVVFNASGFMNLYRCKGLREILPHLNDDVDIYIHPGKLLKEMLDVNVLKKDGLLKEDDSIGITAKQLKIYLNIN